MVFAGAGLVMMNGDVPIVVKVCKRVPPIVDTVPPVALKVGTGGAGGAKGGIILDISVSL